MNYKDIERIAELEECSNLEFKESTGQLDRSMETLCAFLNADGGDILYGIKDNGKIIGQEQAFRYTVSHFHSFSDDCDSNWHNRGFHT